MFIKIKKIKKHGIIIEYNPLKKYFGSTMVQYSDGIGWNLIYHAVYMTLPWYHSKYHGTFLSDLNTEYKVHSIPFSVL